MIDGQPGLALSSGGVDSRVRGPALGIPALGRSYMPPTLPGARGGSALVRSDPPISSELAEFLLQQISRASADGLDALTTGGAPTLATLLIAPEPWPTAMMLELLQRSAALVDAADAAGIPVGTFTPSCIVLSGRTLVLARPDARAGIDPALVAPEQLQPGARVDGRATQYGFALVALTVLGGRMPSPGFLGAVRGRRSSVGALSPECARAVQRVVLMARDPDPARRFGTVSEFVAALGAACGAWALSEPLPPAIAAPPSTRGVMLAVGMLGVAACAGAMGWYAARRPVPIPAELANDIAFGRVVTDTSRGTVAAELDARAVRDAYGERLLMAAPPADSQMGASDAFSRSALAGPAPGRINVPSLPNLPSAIALPGAGLARETTRAVAVPSAEFAAAGVAQSVRREAVSGSSASETAPVLLNDGDGPAYPADLRQTRLQGDVVVRFVIDSSGRVDAGTFQVVRSAHSAFTSSVLSALGHLRYRPAERGGRHVSASVEQRFQFALPAR